MTDKVMLIECSYMAIGFAWLAYVLLKSKRVREGTAIACIFCWPITLPAYIHKLLTGRSNRFELME